VVGVVLGDATPPQAGGDPMVAAGFAVAGALARALRAGTRSGVTQLLLRLGLVPGYPGRRRLRRRLGPGGYRDWRAAVVRGFGHGAAAELRAVPAVARAAAPLLDPGALGGLPLGVVSSAAYGPKWETWQGQWTTGARWHVHTRTGDRYHDVHLRHPELVVDVVRQVLAASAGAAQTGTGALTTALPEQTFPRIER
jgi:hypothetical protein